MNDPRGFGEALNGATLGQFWKRRVGDWRIICDSRDDRIVPPAPCLGELREVHR